MNIQPALQTDYYKVNHHRMYKDGTSKIYSNLTPRKSRMEGVNNIVVFGIQYFILEYLIKQWNEEFFLTTSPLAPETRKSKYFKDKVISQYKRMMDYTLGKDSVTTKHLEDLWDLGYMPLEIKALPEGTLCPIGVPCLTITNTVDHAYWLVNYLETIMSCILWQPMTSATIAHEYKKLLNKFAKETTGNAEFVQWQGHDFSFRGMSSLESACTSGAGHLLSFTGTDTIPAICFLEGYYGANIEKELVGSSVPATEHSVMCMGTKDDEIGTFKELMDKFPKGILSVVSDTWDLWKVLTKYLPALKGQIMAREGKLVIRPDSGDPVDIICGTFKGDEEESYEVRRKIIDSIRQERNIVLGMNKLAPEKGVIELLWDIFGGTINEQGYKELDSHIGAIYGDSITRDRAREICERLKAKGFASTNIVLGIGSYTYQYNTRDTFGFAVKATYGEITHTFEDEPHLGEQRIEAREIFKDPITDDGTKKSAKGLLAVFNDANYLLKEPFLKDQCTKEEEKKGLLETVFLDGKLTKFQTLTEIRNKLKENE